MDVAQMQEEQKTFQQAMYGYLTGLVSQMATVTANWIGNVAGDLLGQIPYVGPILSPLARTFIPYAFTTAYQGLSL